MQDSMVACKDHKSSRYNQLDECIYSCVSSLLRLYEQLNLIMEGRLGCRLVSA